MPIKREIIYPIFLECCQYCDDPFWESIFEDLAYGKTPQGTYISKNFLSCSYKNKEFSYKIERNNPENIYNDLYTFFTDKLGILSLKEKNKKKIEFNEVEKLIKKSRNEWSSIRRKNIKDVMYEKYAIDMKEKHNLTSNQAKYLLSLILVSIMFKIITSKDIIYRNDKIIHIEGINIENGEIILERTINPCNANRDYNNLPKLLSDNWEKYLRRLNEYNAIEPKI